MSGFELGVVADDFTGASDAASFMVQGGLDTVLFSGVPEGKISMGPGRWSLR